MLYLQAYRRAYEGQVGKGHIGGRPVMASLDTSPGLASPSLCSSRDTVPSKHRNKPTYVQRFKVLRDRNKNLPKLDFSEKASGIPKVWMSSKCLVFVNMVAFICYVYTDCFKKSRLEACSLYNHSFSSTKKSLKTLW